MSERAIGIFDSGLGGLTVLKEVKKLLPNENIIYFGDTARVPYGSKTMEQVKEYTTEAIEFLITKNVKAIIIACNTATASALEEVVDKYDIPIIGVISPGVRAISSTSKNKKIAIIATEGTVKSKAYEKEIYKVDPTIKTMSLACPSFVSVVEEGLVGTSIAYGVVKSELEHLKYSNIDTLVLGCTHFPHLQKEIKEVLGSKVKLVDPAKETSYSIKEELLKKGTLRNVDEEGVCEYYVSKQPEMFKDIAQQLIRIKIEEVKRAH